MATRTIITNQHLYKKIININQPLRTKTPEVIKTKKCEILWNETKRDRSERERERKRDKG